jgi:hypothetical protein
MNTLTKLALGLIGQLKADPAQAGAADAIVLPPANTAGGLPLMQAMALRQSQREFAPEPLPQQLLSTMLRGAISCIWCVPRMYAGSPATRTL